MERTLERTLEQRLEALEQSRARLERENRLQRRLLLSLALLGLVLFLPRAGVTQTTGATLEERVKLLETKVTNLQSRLMHFTRVGNDVFITGANLHIRNGLKATNGNPQLPHSNDPEVTRTNGVGNLIVGYNERLGDGSDVRTGSHTLVVGPYHRYGSYGGLVAGKYSTLAAPHASVSGGSFNTASAEYASVGGGQRNTASGRWASVSGGQRNTAFGEGASVTGGDENFAGGAWASISGGKGSFASGPYASVSGGAFHTANGQAASVSGGYGNSATGNYASVSGGILNNASGSSASVSGGQRNTASGIYASASGGTGINQGAENGWSAGTYTGDGFGLYKGRFRSP